jgi:ATP-dependent Clp protease ATP-binding subunit ClpX
MVGQTGTGKTLVAKTIAKMLDVPLAILMQRYYRSRICRWRCGSILTRLLQAADYDVAKQNAESYLLTKLIKLPVRVIIHRLHVMYLVKYSIIEAIRRNSCKCTKKEDVSTQTKICWSKYTKHLVYCWWCFWRNRENFKRLNRQAVGYSTSKTADNIDKDNLLQYIIPKDIKILV